MWSFGASGFGRFEFSFYAFGAWGLGFGGLGLWFSVLGVNSLLNRKD